MQFNYKHTTSTVNESFDNKRDSKVFDTIPENPYLFIIDFCNEIVNRHRKRNKQIKKEVQKCLKQFPKIRICYWPPVPFPHQRAFAPLCFVIGVLGMMTTIRMYVAVGDWRRTQYNKICLDLLLHMAPSTADAVFPQRLSRVNL